MLLASIEGIVFSEAVQNGNFEPAAGDLPLAGRTVFLDLNGNGRFDAPQEPTQRTGTDGTYRFENLPFGDYSVGQVVAIDSSQHFPVRPEATVRLIDVTANDLVYDPIHGKIYASTTGDAAALPKSIVVVDPVSGNVTGSVALGQAGGKLAVSDDGQYLYVAMDAAVQRVDLATLSLGTKFSIAPRQVADMAVMPGQPHTIALSTYEPGVGNSLGVPISIYDNGVQRPQASGRGNVFTFGETADVIYGYINEFSSFDFNQIAVTASGTVGTRQSQNLIYGLLYGFGVDIEFDGGLVYATNGVVIDPKAWSVLGTFQGDGSVEPISSRGLTFFLSGHELTAFDQRTFLPVGSFTLPEVNDTLSGLIHWGTQGLALRTSSGQIALVDWNPWPAMHHIAVAQGQSAVDQNFADHSTLQPGSVSGRLYNDADASGLPSAGEPAMPGWTVFIDQNTNGQLDAGERSTLSDSQGNYSFNGLAPGDYSVTALPPSGWQQTAPVQQGVVRRIDVPTNDMVYSPITGRLYASIGSGVAAIGNSIAVIDPDVGEIVATVSVGSEPNQLAVSDDGQFLYVSILGAEAIARVDLATLTVDQRFSIGRIFISDLEVPPGQPNSVVIATLEPDLVKTRIYDNGVLRPQGASSDFVTFGNSPSVLYGFEGAPFNTFRRLIVGPTGLELTHAIDDLISGDIEFAGGLLYSTDGKVLDPETQTIVGTTTSGSVEPDAAQGLTFYVSGGIFSAYDQETFALVRRYTLAGIGASQGLIRWGAQGLATLDENGHIVLVEWDPRHPLNGLAHTAHISSGASAAGYDFGFQSTAPGDAPVGHSELFDTSEDVGFSVAAPGVLANDFDADSPFTAVLVAGPTRGTLTLNPDGSFSYIPSANLNGIDRFTYRAYDGQRLSPVTTVSIKVASVRDRPVAANDTYKVPEDGIFFAVQGNGVLTNDSDPDSSLTTLLETPPAHGSLTLNSNGSFKYQPDVNFNGQDFFTYRASDVTLLSNVATVTLNVVPANDPPVAAPETYSLQQNSTLSIAAPGVLQNDTDTEGSQLTAALVAGPAHGTISLHDDGSFTYEPTARYVGNDTFTYHASDGFLISNPATVSLSVVADNSPPEATAPDATPALVAHNDVYAAAEDGSLVIATADGVLKNDSGPEGSSLFAVLEAGPARGTLTLQPDGSFAYRPDADFAGSDRFLYRASDRTSTSAVATVTINLVPENDAPTALADRFTTVQGAALTVSIRGVLANDADVENDALTAVLDSPPSHGTVTLASEGNFVYRPDPAFHGGDVFTYHALDTASSSPVEVTITVLEITPVNDAPSFTPGSDLKATDESGSQFIGHWATSLLAGPLDESEQQLTFIVQSVSNPELFAVPPTIDSDGNLAFVPRPNAAGVAQVSIVLQDGGGIANGGQDTSAPQTFTIEVTKPHAWSNAAERLDVSGDTFIAPGDALAVINYLNAFGPGPVTPDATFRSYYDSNRDNFISAADALDVIDYLNAQAANRRGNETKDQLTSTQSVRTTSQSLSANGLLQDEIVSLLAIDNATRRERVNPYTSLRG